MFLRKNRAKRAVHCLFGSNFCSNTKITVSICALDAYTQYLSDCQKSLYSIMLGRKTRAKRAVRFFTTRLALVFFRGILVAFSLQESTPQILRHSVYMILCHLVSFFLDTRYLAIIGQYFDSIQEIGGHYQYNIQAIYRQ